MFLTSNPAKTLRYLFIGAAILIAIASVWVTNTLVNALKEEERKKIEIWAESVTLMYAQALTAELNTDLFNNYDKLLVDKIIEGNVTIPLIVTDENDQVTADGTRNLLLPKTDDANFIARKIKAFKKKHQPIRMEIPIGENENLIQYIYYDDSTVLKQLQMFPYI
ncbi:MAG: hypothetical protein LBG77_00480, partial [Dysgonamonadaceae bacterium]|nr:hypothetical protein [Dysgonamonadaceae bacterium]